jgi:hypothetical protein
MSKAIEYIQRLILESESGRDLLVLLSPRDRKVLYWVSKAHWNILDQAKQKYDWLKDSIKETVNESILVYVRNKETEESKTLPLIDALNLLGSPSHNIKDGRTDYYSLNSRNLSPWEVIIPIQNHKED